MSAIGVREYFSGKSVFITGATGFMGKVLVEKLLHSCPGLKLVYLLVRPKKGQSAEERLRDFLNNRVFERLQGTTALSKIRMVPGDVLLENLGISREDQMELQQNCNIVFHCAATVRFDMFLKDAVNMNVLGTLKVLQLADGMTNLEAFVHVSTSFCHDEVPVLEEQMYPSRHSPRDVIACMRWMDDDMIRTLEPKLIHPLPNTYGYTKCLSEDLLLEFQGRFPIAIARPSIVTAAYKEPLPGWVDQINGPTGMILAAARGVLRTVYCHKDTLSEGIPVDLAINGCILLAYTTGLEKPKEIRVCNLTQSGVNSHTWTKAGEMWYELIGKYPLSLCLWYPNARACHNKFWYKVQVYLTQLLPALFLDLLLFLLGKKTFMLHVYNKISKSAELLDHYITRDWKFKNPYFRSLKKRISQEDDEVFFTDFEDLDFPTYMEDYVKGVREYYCKEDVSTLPKAKRLHTQLYILHITTKVIFICLCLYFVYVKLF